MGKLRVPIIQLVALGSVLLHCPMGWATVPEWAKKSTQRREGHSLMIVTKGQGPSVDLARKDALAQARSAAIDQVATSVRAKSLAISSEASTAYFEEVSASHTVKDLSCEIQDEHLVEGADGSHLAYIKAKCDLKKARVIPTTKEGDDSDQPESSLVADKDALEAPPLSGEIPKGPEAVQSDSRALIVSVIPRCIDFLVVGQKSRRIACDTLPKTLLIYPGDQEMIVRGPRGYKPKTVKLNPGRMPASLSEVERLELHLEQ